MSVKTINLLPKQRQSELVLRSWYRGLLHLYAFSTATFVLVALLFVGVGAYLRIADSSLKQEADALRQQSAKQENADLKKQIATVNNQITDYTGLATAVPRWSVLLKEFAEVVPEGVQIQNFNVDSTKRLVSVSGFAPTRELVIRLYDNIVQDAENFTGIDYPLENVTRPTNINFRFTFMVNEQVLQSPK